MSLAVATWVELMIGALHEEGVDGHVVVDAMERANAGLAENIEGWRRELDNANTELEFSR